jgi:hypothetical protein
MWCRASSVFTPPYLSAHAPAPLLYKGWRVAIQRSLSSFILLVPRSYHMCLVFDLPIFDSFFFDHGKSARKPATKSKSKKSSSSLGPSQTKDKDTDHLTGNDFISSHNAVIRPMGETNPSPRPGYTLVFVGFFEAGLN